MRDFGADSLEVVEVTSRSMKQLGLRVPRSDLVKVSNIGELADAFVRASQSPRVAV
jgi:acyl carrier protein